MIRVERSRHIAAQPSVVFATLSNPERLPRLLPRVQRVEFITHAADHARIATYMSFGPLGTIRTEGDLRWQTDREVFFIAQRPVLVEARWTLTPARGGTELRAALALDLAPLIGPLAGLVPDQNVAEMIEPDLDAALDAVARSVVERV